MRGSDVESTGITHGWEKEVSCRSKYCEVDNL
jgi:hypothetical protein